MYLISFYKHPTLLLQLILKEFQHLRPSFEKKKKIRKYQDISVTKNVLWKAGQVQ